MFNYPHPVRQNPTLNSVSFTVYSKYFRKFTISKYRRFSKNLARHIGFCFTRHTHQKCKMQNEKRKVINFLNLFSRFLDLIFPKKCFGCGRDGEFLCGQCFNSLDFPEIRCFICRKGGAGFCAQCASFFGLENLCVFWAADYRNNAIKKIIRTFKYRQAGALAETLGEILSQRTEKLFIKNSAGASLIIPVPLAPKRQRERGFNQAALLGRYFAQKNGLAFDSEILLKIKNTAPQVGTAGRGERLENLKESFAVSDFKKIQGKTVILVDDVLTTGATIMECARALQKAGVKKIIALVAAR